MPSAVDFRSTLKLSFSGLTRLADAAIVFTDKLVLLRGNSRERPFSQSDDVLPVSVGTVGPSKRWRPWVYRRELVLAFALVVTSHLFVLMFAKIARWELQVTGGSRLAVAQLERCREGNGRPLDEACQFDCCWYSSIIRSGYDKEPRFGAGDRANWNYFPLFPLFASPLYRALGIESTHVAVLGGKFALYLAILAFWFLVHRQSEGFGDTVLAGTLVAFNPGIIYAHGGYAEPLYFALAAFGLALLDRQRWVGAGLAGGLLSATRLVGVVFCVAYAIAAIRTGALSRALKDRRLAVLIGALLCPAGLSLYMLYMYRDTGDALASVHIYAGWGISSGNPFTVIWEGLRAGEWARFWSCLAIASWAVSAWLVVQRQYEKAAFLALAVLVPVTAEVAGMQRFVWWQPPTLYAAFVLLKHNPRVRGIYFVFAGGMAAVMTLLWFLGGRSVV